MRWERLFDDLEAAFEAEERAELDAEVADLARAERAALRLVDRLRAHVGHAVAVHLVEGGPVEGRLAEVGDDWLLLTVAGTVAPSALVPVAAVSGVDGLGRAATGAPAGGRRGIGLTVVLRALARDRGYVRLGLRGGATLGGTIDRVGADHLDLAVHPQDEPRRPRAVVGVRTVPLAALVVVRGDQAGER